MKTQTKNQGEILVGLNSDIPENLIREYSIQSYRKKCPDGNTGDFFYLPNGKPGCFCASKDFLVISKSTLFQSRIINENKCKIEVSFYSDSTKIYFEIVTVYVFPWSKLKEKEKEIQLACSFANSCVKRAASVLNDENKLKTFISEIQAQKSKIFS